MPLTTCLLPLLLSLAQSGAQTPAPPAPQKDPATIVIVRLNDHSLTLADALATFNTSHTGHGALVRGEAALRELAGRMIERELFLAEAEALGVPDDAMITRAVEDYQRTLLADLYWKAEVFDKIKVTDEEIDAFYNKTDVALKVTLIQTEKREECEALLKRVAAGEDMVALATAQSTHESRSFGGRLPYVRRGDLDAQLEKPLFALEEPGKLTEVVQVAKGFAFARLDERSVNPDRLPKEVATPQIRKILRDRAEDTLRTALEKRLETEGGITLEDKAFNPERLFAGDEGREAVARSVGQELTLAELRDALDLDALRSTDPDTIAGVARQVAREWALRLVVWKIQGGAAGIADPEAQRKVQGFRREMILSVLCDRYVFPKEPLTEADLHKYYEENRETGFTRPPERRLAYIVSPTQEESADILKRIQAGEDFEAIAKQVSKDRRSAVHGGRIGWIKKGEILPEVESRVFPLPNGSIDGPIETPQGWFLVRVMDRREPELIPFESARPAIQKRLVKARQQEAYVKWASALRERAEVSFDAEGLREAVAWLDQQPKPDPKPMDPASPHSQPPGADPAGKGQKP